MTKPFQILFLGVAIFCGCRSAPTEEQPPSPGNRPQPASALAQASDSPDAAQAVKSLAALNQLFLGSYRAQRTFVRTNISPLIVADFDTLTLFWNGATETNHSIPDLYHSLKAVAHVPFTIYLGVSRWTKDDNSPVPDEVATNLSSISEHITAVEQSMENAGFSPAQLRRQSLILLECKTYLRQVLLARRTSKDGLVSFARRVAPLMLANAHDAAAAQLDLTHAAVMGWKSKIPPNDWKRLVVVVRGPQMPRRFNILTQYFARVLNTPSHGLGYPLESRRLIYAEFIPGSGDPLDLLATTFVDGDASEVFFKDRWRLSRDLLADGAKAHLDRMTFN